jgi:DNA-cytosine methyltransferase
MKILSLFDGMSCGQIALKELGFTIDKYYASEIDKFAIQQTQFNFPNTIQLGDVTKVKAADLDKIDLLIGGSPCQGFSFAGKQLNFNDDRSKLFFEFVRIWHEVKQINPDALFMLENVNMKKEYLRVISEYLGVFPVRINSNLVSAQNRDRWYWTNIKTKDVGLFAELWSDVEQPKDRNILLKDVLESDVDKKYYLSDQATIGLLKHKKRADLNKWGFGAKLHNENDKCNAIKVGGKGKDDIVCVAMRGRNPENTSDRTTGSPTQQRLEPKTDGKTNTLTSVSKDNLIIQMPHGYNKGGVFDEKSPTVLSSSWEHNNLVMGSCRLRRLTPLECLRLQTIPDWYKWTVSDTQIYRMLGNGWTVEVIKHIFSLIKQRNIKK